MNKVIKLVKHPLISGSSVVLVGSLMANLGHYVFNLVMGRLLTPVEYGLIASLISLASLFAIFQTSLTSTFAKFAARFQAGNDSLRMSDLIKKGLGLNFKISLAIFLFLLVISPFLMDFLHISDLKIVLLVYLFIFISTLSSLPNGILQGELRTFLYSLLSILNSVLKIILGVSLVFLGFGVLGAVGGIVIAITIPYFIALAYILKKNLKHKLSDDADQKNLIIKEFRDYSSKFFLASLGMTMFISVDIILARHFFDPTLAGQYAALSIMGKAIFYLIFPIHFIFFPLIAQKKEKKENVLEVLLLGAIITILACVSASFIYFLFPGLILSIFFPLPSYKILIPYLGPFSLYILIFSVASLMNNYLLSIGKMGIYKINLFCGLFLVVLIILFHESLFQVIGALFAGSLSLLSLLLIYYWYNGRD